MAISFRIWVHDLLKNEHEFLTLRECNVRKIIGTNLSIMNTVEMIEVSVIVFLASTTPILLASQEVRKHPKYLREIFSDSTHETISPHICIFAKWPPYSACAGHRLWASICGHYLHQSLYTKRLVQLVFNFYGKCPESSKIIFWSSQAHFTHLWTESIQSLSQTTTWK